MPRPPYAGSTMKLAFATWAPGPAWLGWVLAVPTTVPATDATTVRPGDGNQAARAACSLMSRGQV